MNGYGYIEDVENIFKCTKICLQVGDCHHASFDTKNKRCYLKNAKGPEGVQYDGDFQTAPQHCQSNSCVLQVSSFMTSNTFSEYLTANYKSENQWLMIIYRKKIMKTAILLDMTWLVEQLWHQFHQSQHPKHVKSFVDQLKRARTSHGKRVATASWSTTQEPSNTPAIKFLEAETACKDKTATIKKLQ